MTDSSSTLIHDLKPLRPLQSRGSKRSSTRKRHQPKTPEFAFIVDEMTTKCRCRTYVPIISLESSAELFVEISEPSTAQIADDQFFERSLPPSWVQESADRHLQIESSSAGPPAFELNKWEWKASQICSAVVSCLPTPAPCSPILWRWKLLTKSLLASLSLFSVNLATPFVASATSSEGAVDFSLSSNATSPDSSSIFSPLINQESTLPPEVDAVEQPLSEPESEPEEEIAPSSELEQEPESTRTTPQASESLQEADPSRSMIPRDSSTNRPGGAVSFAPTISPTIPPIPSYVPAIPSVSPTPPPQSQPNESSDDIFNGGSDSLVARTVGHAEGTRTPNGSKTRAYYGHTDPGNSVWNLGSFSFQHCREAQYNCSSPEQADVHQLKRLKGQAESLRQRAKGAELEMTRLEELNGIDLANQAPLAALGNPGYIDWLKKAREMGLKDEEAVLWARVKSYWDPNFNGWNAPGLGNSESRIQHDQNRRLTAIARALEIYEQQVAAGKISTSTQDKLAAKPKEEQAANNIIFQNLTN